MQEPFRQYVASSSNGGRMQRLFLGFTLAISLFIPVASLQAQEGTATRADEILDSMIQDEWVRCVSEINLDWLGAQPEIYFPTDTQSLFSDFPLETDPYFVGMGYSDNPFEASWQPEIIILRDSSLLQYMQESGLISVHGAPFRCIVIPETLFANELWEWRYPEQEEKPKPFYFSEEMWTSLKELQNINQD